jgi:hypothetical protein
MWQMFCMNGKQQGDWAYVNGLLRIPLPAWPSMISDGPCHQPEKCEVIPKGVFKNLPAIFYSNGNGHYCLYKTMDELWCLTGKKGKNKWQWLDSRPEFIPEEYPGTTYDGYCWSKKCSRTP